MDVITGKKKGSKACDTTRVPGKRKPKTLWRDIPTNLGTEILLEVKKSC